MHNKTITLKVTLDVDEVWAAKQTKTDIVDCIRKRMSNGLGFRGQIREFRVERNKV